MTDDQPRGARRFFSQLSLPWVLLVVTAVGLIVAPLFKNEFDMQTWWNWAGASDGARPWQIYLRRPDCDYPPFVLYILTVLQAILKAFAWQTDSGAAFVLLKIPGLIAFAATPLLVRMWVRPVIGEAMASATACVCALCAPVWFNAAVWGQWDALLSLAMMAAVIALWRERAAWSGAAIGLALSIKLQAIMIVPVLLVYCVRRLGMKTAVKLVILAAVVWSVVAVPVFAPGGVRGVRQSYIDVVGWYPVFSACAFNGWMLAQTWSSEARRWPDQVGRSDKETIVGSITVKQVGLAIFSLYLAFVLWGLWRHPSGDNFLFAAGLCAYVFFMLLTQMHERYVLPACMLLTLIALRGGWWIYLAVALPALINQIIAMVYENAQGNRLTLGSYHAFQYASLVFSAINVGLLIWISWRYVRQTFIGSPVQSADMTLQLPIGD